jgi:hypothetical protein
MKKLFSTAAIIAALASALPASAQRTGPGPTANTATGPGVLPPGGFGPSPLHNLNEESAGLSGGAPYPQRLVLVRLLEVMALLDEAACDPTCGELRLRTPEVPDEEFRALIAKWRHERPSGRLNE